VSASGVAVRTPATALPGFGRSGTASIAVATQRCGATVRAVVSGVVTALARILCDRKLPREQLAACSTVAAELFTFWVVLLDFFLPFLDSWLLFICTVTQSNTTANDENVQVTG
jgi:hypothetical protein